MGIKAFFVKSRLRERFLSNRLQLRQGNQRSDLVYLRFILAKRHLNLWNLNRFTLGYRFHYQLRHLVLHLLLPSIIRFRFPRGVIIIGCPLNEIPIFARTQYLLLHFLNMLETIQNLLKMHPLSLILQLVKLPEDTVELLKLFQVYFQNVFFWLLFFFSQTIFQTLQIEIDCWHY